MVRTKHSMSEMDRRYFKHKMKQIKKARNKGNRAAMERHAIELKQYFGVDDADAPVTDVLPGEESDEESEPFRSMIDNLSL